jgi:hypothetical protein
MALRLPASMAAPAPRGDLPNEWVFSVDRQRWFVKPDPLGLTVAFLP